MTYIYIPQIRKFKNLTAINRKGTEELHIMYSWPEIERERETVGGKGGRERDREQYKENFRRKNERK